MAKRGRDLTRKKGKAAASGSRRRQDDDEDSSSLADSQQPNKCAKSGRQPPRSANPGAPPRGPKVMICTRCKENDKDKLFALDQKLPLAQPDQCCDCYYIWVPLSMLLQWDEFCTKYEDDEDFRRRVKAASKNPNKMT
eukprot:1071004-Pyramimonas_sp.AAC.1